MASILHKNFATNKNLEREGITVEYFDPEEVDEKPVRIKIARAGGSNVAYDKELDKATKAIRRQIGAGQVSLAKIRTITRDVFAKTVVLGWENVKDENGVAIPFTPEAALKLFTDLPDLFDDLQEQASNAGLFRAGQLEDDAKN